MYSMMCRGRGPAAPLPRPDAGQHPAADAGGPRAGFY